MAGKNNGTGQPMFFKCAGCRGATRFDVDLTGRIRPAPLGNARGRSDLNCREYKCRKCGHVGWSRHTDLGRTPRSYDKKIQDPPT